MRFRLKDRELQKKLDEISNGGLSRMLGRLPYYTTQSSEPDFLHFSKNPHLMLEVTSDMLESLREYNPHGWNSFPEVEPPEGVLMRVECNQMKTCLVFENGKWRYPSGESFENYEFAFPVKRFRQRCLAQYLHSRLRSGGNSDDCQ